MKKLLVCVLIIAGALTLSSCMKGVEEPASDTTELTTVQTTKAEQSTKGNHSMTAIINNKEFSVTLEDNDTAKAFSDMLPVTLTMSELHGNEKYNYLDVSLPSNPQNIAEIHKGDIMLYDDDCIVIFYKDFETSYAYTKIGQIENADSLEERIGNGSVDVSFQ